MPVWLWVLGCVGFLLFAGVALSNLSNPAQAAVYGFLAFLSLYALGWMAETLKGVDAIKDLLSRRSRED